MGGRRQRGMLVMRERGAPPVTCIFLMPVAASSGGRTCWWTQVGKGQDGVPAASVCPPVTSHEPYPSVTHACNLLLFLMLCLVPEVADCMSVTRLPALPLLTALVLTLLPLLPLPHAADAAGLLTFDVERVGEAVLQLWRRWWPSGPHPPLPIGGWAARQLEQQQERASAGAALMGSSAGEEDESSSSETDSFGMRGGRGVHGPLFSFWLLVAPPSTNGWFLRLCHPVP